jgi:hypothetical protein
VCIYIPRDAAAEGISSGREQAIDELLFRAVLLQSARLRVCVCVCVLSPSAYICMCACACVCVCVVNERETDRESVSEGVLKVLGFRF